MKLKVILAFLFVLLFFVNGFSQNRKTTLADEYFKNKEYKNALNVYSKALKNSFFKNSESYKILYLKFKIAESKMYLNDSLNIQLFNDFINQYQNISLDKRSTSLQKALLLIAESKNCLKNYKESEWYYNRAIKELDSIPDYFKFKYAECSYSQNRFGQAKKLFDEIMVKGDFEPELSNYLFLCNSKLDESISGSIKEKDTLVIIMNYLNCFGGKDYKLEIIKTPANYRVNSYKLKIDYTDHVLWKDSDSLEELGLINKKTWEFYNTQQINDSAFQIFFDFENELKNYIQFEVGRCTLKAEFSIKMNLKSYNVDINDCAYLGWNIIKFLKIEI
ncbi:MAG: hypothetical protein WCK02_10785 [Bacteroidota bacterium]